MLRAINAGATWNEVRKIDAGYDGMALCPRCGTAPESSSHRAFECPCNDTEECKYLDGTDVMKRAAVSVQKRGELVPCYWFRGLVPRQMINDIIQKDERVAENSVDGCAFAAGVAAANPNYRCRGDIYVDGSGTHEDPRVRRAGWGVATLTCDSDESA